MKAFPLQFKTESDVHINTGMDLRDYFAAKAMQSLIEDEYDDSFWLAKQAYAFADAMMEARK